MYQLQRLTVQLWAMGLKPDFMEICGSPLILIEFQTI